MESAVSAPVSGHVKRVAVQEGLLIQFLSPTELCSWLLRSSRRFHFSRRPHCRDCPLEGSASFSCIFSPPTFFFYYNTYKSKIKASIGAGPSNVVLVFSISCCSQMNSPTVAELGYQIEFLIWALLFSDVWSPELLRIPSKYHKIRYTNVASNLHHIASLLASEM